MSDSDETPLLDDDKKSSNVSAGGIAFAFVFVFIIAIVGLVLAAIAMADLGTARNQISILNNQLKTMGETVTKINDVFSDNYGTLKITDLKFGNNWGITHGASELQFYGTNPNADNKDCVFMFFKNNGAGQPKSFFLSGISPPGELSGSSMTSCCAPGTFC